MTRRCPCHRAGGAQHNAQARERNKRPGRRRRRTPTTRRRSCRRAAACPPPKNDRRHQHNTTNLGSRQLDRGVARQDPPPLVRLCGTTTRDIPEKEKAASVGERFMRRDYPCVSNASGLGEWRVGVLSRRLTARSLPGAVRCPTNSAPDRLLRSA